MGASEDQISNIEQHFEVTLPEDCRQFLSTSDGMSESLPPAGNFLAFASPTRLVANNSAGSLQERFPAAAAVGGDGSRGLLVYDFRQDRRRWPCSTSPQRTGPTPSVRHPR